MLPVQHCCFFFNRSQTLTLQRNKIPPILPNDLTMQILSTSKSQLQNPQHSHLLQLPATQHSSSSLSHPTANLQCLTWECHSLTVPVKLHVGEQQSGILWNPLLQESSEELSPTISMSACPQAGSDPPSLVGQGIDSLLCPPQQQDPSSQASTQAFADISSSLLVPDAWG